MKSVTVINKKSLDKDIFTKDIIDLKTASIIHLKYKKEDVQEFKKVGNNLIITMKNGDVITLENFFEVYRNDLTSDLVFDDDACAFLWFDWNNGVVSFKEISGLELLIPETSALSNMTPWLIGGGVGIVGGLAAGGSGGGSNGKSSVAKTIKITDIEVNEPNENSKNNGSKISGKASPHTDIYVTVNGKELEKITSDKDGFWTIDTDKSINELTEILAVIKSNNSDQPLAQDNIEIPYISINTVATDDIINQQESISDDGFTTLTGAWIYPEHLNPEISINLNNVIYTAENGLNISSDGSWSLKVPTKEVFKEGQINKIEATILDELNIPHTAEREVKVDTILDQPKIIISEKGIIQIAYPEDQGKIDVNPSEIKVYDSFGVPINVDFTQTADGKILSAQLPEGLLGDVKVVVPEGSYIDWAGNIGTEISATAKVDTDFPVVKITVRENGEIVLTYPKDVDTTKIAVSKVKVYNDKGNVIPNLNFELKDDGSYQAQIQSGYDNNVKVVVPADSYFDLTGNKGATIQNSGKVDTKDPTVKIEIQQPNQNGETTVKFTFSEKIKPESFEASDIQITNGMLDPQTLVQVSDTVWQANVNSVPGSTLTVGVKDQSYMDLVGNTGEDGSAKIITISIDSIIPQGNNKSTINGKTEPNQIVEVTLADGSKQKTTSLADGSWSILVKDTTLAGDKITAKTPGINSNTWVVDTKELPFVSIDVIAENDVIDVDELNELTTSESLVNKGLDISGHLINPSQVGVLVVNVDGVDYVAGDNGGKAQLTVNSDGSWFLHINDNTEILDRTKALSDITVEDKKSFEVKAYLAQTTENLDAISNVAERHPKVEHEVGEPTITFENGQIVVKFGDNVDVSKDYSQLIHITDKQDTTDQKFSNIQFTQDPDDSSRYVAIIPENQDFDIDVKVDPEYSNIYGDKGAQVQSAVHVDTMPPQVEVEIDVEGNVKFNFDQDVDISTIDWSLITLKIKNANDEIVELKGEKTIADGVEQISFVGLTPSELMKIDVSNQNNEHVFEAKVNLLNGSEVIANVPNGSFEDQYRNKGIEGGDSQVISKALPTVLVDYLPEDSVQDELEVFKISFSEEIIFNNSENDDVSELLKEYIGSTISGMGSVLEIIDNGNNEYLLHVQPKKDQIGDEFVTKTVIITIPSSIYTDKIGNLGANTSEDSSKGKNLYVGFLQESGVDACNYIVKGISEVILDNNTPEHQISNIVSKNTYGEIKIVNGELKFILDNSKEVTQALAKYEKVTQDYQYTSVGIDGVEKIHVGTLKITGSNDAPVIEQTKARVLEPIEGSFSFENSTITNPTVVNSTQKSEHLMGFELKAEDLTTTQIYVNLKKLDNSFKIEINGKSIHLNEVFQIEAGDKTTPTQVPLLFADGTWLAAGAPWNANDYGLPRFQIIISDTGIRFFGTKTSQSQYLEEIFYDQSYASNIQLPQFVVGKNTLNIINVDGVGVDAMVGEVTITAGGKFHISDVDSEKLNGIEVRISNYVKGDTFIPVLPKGITYTSKVEGNELVLKLTADTSSDSNAKASKADYEDVLNSLMFKGTANGIKDITVKVIDDFNAYDLITGTLDYKKDNGTIKLTQIDFKESNDDIFNVLETAENVPHDLDVSFSEDNFVLGSGQKIDISSLLEDEVTNENISQYINFVHNAATSQVEIFVDRDGEYGSIYQPTKIMVLNNQSNSIQLDDLLQHNQLVY